MPVPIPLAFNSYQARSGLASSQRLVNVYLEKNPESSPFPFSLYGTAGLTAWKNFSQFDPVYGFEKMGEFLYTVVGLNVFRVNSSGTSLLIGTLPTSPDRVMMCNNGTQLTILTSGGQAFSCTSSAGSLVQIASNYPLSDSITNLDGFAIASVQNNRTFQISSLNDNTTWAASDIASVEGNSEKITRVISNGIELWFFKESMIEVFYNSANPLFPFERKNGAIIQRGSKAKFSISQSNNSFYFLGSDNIVYRTSGYQFEAISTFAISKEIESYAVKDDAFGFNYTIEGHQFYALGFPSENKFWEFDISLGLWHERESSGGMWRANCFVNFAGKNLVGDSQTGIIYELDLDIFTENGDTLARKIVSTTQFDNFYLHTLDQLTLVMDTGVGIDGSAQGITPQIMLKVSTDGGKNYSNEMWQPIGSIGTFETEVFWTSLGYGRSVIFEIAMSDPVKFAINGAYLNTSKGGS